jgi:glutaredoxin
LNNTILYSTNCPKCEILKEKLDEKNITYEICSDVKLMISKGFRSAPILEVNNVAMTYLEAINWIKERN